MTYVPFSDGRRRSRAQLDELEQELRIAAGLDNDPSPRLFDISPIVRLLDTGYELYGDIIPVIRSVAATRVRASNWLYYAKAIERQRSKNVELKPKGGEVVEPTVWVLLNNSRWKAWAEAWRKAKGKSPPHVAGLGGMGWHFPKSLMDTEGSRKKEPAQQAVGQAQSKSSDEHQVTR